MCRQWQWEFDNYSVDFYYPPGVNSLQLSRPGKQLPGQSVFSVHLIHGRNPQLHNSN